MSLVYFPDFINLQDPTKLKLSRIFELQAYKPSNLKISNYLNN